MSKKRLLRKGCCCGGGLKPYCACWSDEASTGDLLLTYSITWFAECSRYSSNLGDRARIPNAARSGSIVLQHAPNVPNRTQCRWQKTISGQLQGLSSHPVTPTCGQVTAFPCTGTPFDAGSNPTFFAEFGPSPLVVAGVQFSKSLTDQDYINFCNGGSFSATAVYEDISSTPVTCPADRIYRSGLVSVSNGWSAPSTLPFFISPLSVLANVKSASFTLSRN